MEIGASLWGLVNQTLENGDNIRCPTGARHEMELHDLGARKSDLPAGAGARIER